MIDTTLVVGGNSTLRELAIKRQLDASSATAVLLHGLPTGHQDEPGLTSGPSLHLIRLAPSCACCVGQLSFTVSLNRLIRQRPVRLFIDVFDPTHLENLRSLLMAAPYDGHLNLTEDLTTSA